MAAPAERRARTHRPGTAADARPRGECGDRQRAAAAGDGDRQEEPRRGLRARRDGGDVEAAPGRRKPRRRTPGPDPGRHQRRAGRRSARPRRASAERSPTCCWTQIARSGSAMLPSSGSESASSPTGTWHSGPSCWRRCRRDERPGRVGRPSVRDDAHDRDPDRGWLRADLSPGAQLGEARADARSGTVPPTPGNRALGRRRRSDVGGAFEHIANAARIPSRRASAIGLDSEAGSAVLRRVLMPESVATAGGGLTCDAQVGSDS